MHQLTFYQLGRENIVSAFLQSELDYPTLQAGDVFQACQFPGLNAFSPHLRVVHAQSYPASLSRRGVIKESWLIITRAFELGEQENDLPELAQWLNQHMAGDL